MNCCILGLSTAFGVAGKDERWASGATKPVEDTKLPSSDDQLRDVRSNPVFKRKNPNVLGQICIPPIGDFISVYQRSKLYRTSIRQY